MSKTVFNIFQSNLPFGDPHICSDSKNRLSLISAVYEPLIARTSPFDFEPCLALGWHVYPGAQLWDIRLRSHVVFHDGSEMKAGDVAASLERIRDPKIGGAFGTQGVYASYLNGARFEVVNEGRLRIHLIEPMADLLELLAEMPIVPEDALDDLPNEHVGSGSYRIRDADRDEIEMSSNEKHWRGKPNYHRLYWRAEPEEKERIKAVVTGEADISSGITVRSANPAESRELRVIRQNGSICVIYMLNCSRGVCEDRRIRQALNLALDKQAIINRIMDGAAEPLTGPLSPLHFGWDPETPGYLHDPFAARELLRQAGYSDGLSIKMNIPSEMPDEAIPLSTLMTEQYREVGISVNMEIHKDRSAYAEMVRKKRIGDLCCFDSSPLSTIRVLKEKINSNFKGPWWQGYTNPEVNRLIEQGQRTINNSERQHLYQRAYRVIRDDAPWVFLYRPENFWAVKTDLDWKPSWDGVIRLP